MSSELDFTTIIQQLMQIFIIVGYSEKEANNRVIQFLTIVEEYASKKIFAWFSQGEIKALIESKEQLSYPNLVKNYDLDAQSSKISKLWRDIAQKVDKQDLITIYQETYEAVLQDYLSSIWSTLNQDQQKKIRDIVPSSEENTF